MAASSNAQSKYPFLAIGRNAHNPASILLQTCKDIDITGYQGNHYESMLTQCLHLNRLHASKESSYNFQDRIGVLANGAKFIKPKYTTLKDILQDPRKDEILKSFQRMGHDSGILDKHELNNILESAYLNGTDAEQDLARRLQMTNNEMPPRPQQQQQQLLPSVPPIPNGGSAAAADKDRKTSDESSWGKLKKLYPKSTRKDIVIRHINEIYKLNPYETWWLYQDQGEFYNAILAQPVNLDVYSPKEVQAIRDERATNPQATLISNKTRYYFGYDKKQIEEDEKELVQLHNAKRLRRQIKERLMDNTLNSLARTQHIEDIALLESLLYRKIVDMRLACVTKMTKETCERNPYCQWTDPKANMNRFRRAFTFGHAPYCESKWLKKMGIDHKDQLGLFHDQKLKNTRHRIYGSETDEYHQNNEKDQKMGVEYIKSHVNFLMANLQLLQKFKEKIIGSSGDQLIFANEDEEEEYGTVLVFEKDLREAQKYINTITEKLKEYKLEHDREMQSYTVERQRLLRELNTVYDEHEKMEIQEEINRIERKHQETIKAIENKNREEMMRIARENNERNQKYVLMIILTVAMCVSFMACTKYLTDEVKGEIRRNMSHLFATIDVFKSEISSKVENFTTELTGWRATVTNALDLAKIYACLGTAAIAAPVSMAAAPFVGAAASVAGAVGAVTGGLAMSEFTGLANLATPFRHIFSLLPSSSANTAAAAAADIALSGLNATTAATAANMASNALNVAAADTSQSGLFSTITSYSGSALYQLSSHGVTTIFDALHQSYQDNPIPTIGIGLLLGVGTCFAVGWTVRLVWKQITSNPIVLFFTDIGRLWWWSFRTSIWAWGKVWNGAKATGSGIKYAYNKGKSAAGYVYDKARNIMSDARLKEDIKHIGNDPVYTDLKLYEWKWNKDAQEKFGLHGYDQGFLAQEVYELYPQSVYVDPKSGYLAIDYQRLANDRLVPMMMMASASSSETSNATVDSTLLPSSSSSSTLQDLIKAREMFDRNKTITQICRRVSRPVLVNLAESNHVKNVKHKTKQELCQAIFIYGKKRIRNRIERGMTLEGGSD
jgi:hypothetical protein